MTEYLVQRWFEIGAQSETVYAFCLEDAVALLKACGDSIAALENGAPRPLTEAEEGLITSLMRKRTEEDAAYMRLRFGARR